MKSDFEHWLSAQFADAGPFTALFAGLSHGGGPLGDAAAAAKLKQVEADVTADSLAFNHGMFFDREGRHMRIDEAAHD
jgi:hypothetical protein